MSLKKRVSSNIVLNTILGMTDDKKRYNNKPPRIFRKQSIPYWWMIFGSVYGLLLYNLLTGTYQLPINEKHVIVFLHIHAEILITILTVTLGVTLLGVQFRAQSYTMHALIDYVNDKVIFLFIFTYGIFIMLDILASTLFFSVPISALIIPFALTNTVVSLCYLAGYIYHMVYKIQPLQVLDDVYDDMSKITNKEIEMMMVGHQKKLNDVTIESGTANKGHNEMIDTIKIIFDNDVEKTLETNNEKYVQALVTLLISLMDRSAMYKKKDIGKIKKEFLIKKNMTLNHMLCLVDKIYETIMSSNVMESFQIWEQIMLKAVNEDNALIFRLGLDKMFTLQNRCMIECDANKSMNSDQNAIRMDRIKLFFYRHIYPVMVSCIELNRERFMIRYLFYMENKYDQLADDKGRIMNSTNRKLEIWNKMMFKAIDENNETVFNQGLNTIFAIQKKYLKECIQNESVPKKDKTIQMNEIKLFFYNSIHSVVLSCVKSNRVILVTVFAKRLDYEHDRFMLSIWREMILRSVHSHDIIVFDVLIKRNFLRKMLNYHDLKNFQEFRSALTESIDKNINVSSNKLDDFISLLDQIIK